MKRILSILAAAVCAASAARADAPRKSEWSISAGGGLAYELVGVNLAYRSGPIEGYVGAGLLTISPGLAFGVRYHLSDDGGGFFVALNGGAHPGLTLSDEATGGGTFWATISPGYRINLDSFFVQGAVGGGLLYVFRTYPTAPSPTRTFGPVPEVMLALGVRF